LLTCRLARTALFKSVDELGIQHFKKVSIVGNEWPVEVGCVQDEHIPARPELDRALEIGFVDPRCFSVVHQFHPFGVNLMPRTTATKLNERSKGCVSPQGRRILSREMPHRLDQALVLAYRYLYLLSRAQMLEASKAGERVSVVPGGSPVRSDAKPQCTLGRCSG
jgi:hypothetical protein